MPSAESPSIQWEKERRIKAVMINPSIVFDVLSNKVQVSYDGIPEQAKVIGCNYDVQRDAVVLFVASAEFEPVELGQVVPTLKVTWTRHPPWDQQMIECDKR